MDMPSINIFIINKPPVKDKKKDRKEELVRLLKEGNEDKKKMLETMENLPTVAHAGGG